MLRWGPTVFLLLLASMSATGSACHQQSPAGLANLGDWEDRLQLYLKAEGPAAPYLSLAKDDVGANTFSGGDATSGTQTTANGLTQQGSRTTFTFTMKAGLPRAHYLNLSKSIQGEIYWSSTVSERASRESSVVRVEVFVDGVRLGGDDCTNVVTFAGTHPVRLPFRFRPELHMLKEGAVLSVKITRIAGSADFTIGTGGTQQSFVEIRTYPSDPLRGTVYLEAGKLQVAGPPEAEESAGDVPGTSDSQDAAWLLVPAGAPLLWATTRRRRRPPVVALACLLLLSGLAGCSGAKSSGLNQEERDDDGPQPTVVQNYTVRPDLVGTGEGAVTGFVHDDTGVAIRDANVIVLGTSLVSRSSPKGTFEFPNVTAGTYLLHVDRTGFEALERSFEVRAGNETHLDVQLVRPGVQTTNTKPHLHDLWGDRTSMPLWSATFTPTFGVAPSQSGKWVCAYYVLCETLVPIQFDQPVLAGTSLLEVKLAWDPLQYSGKEFGLRILTSTNRSLDQTFIPRPAGERFQIPIFPNEADPGHQGFTLWELHLRIRNSVSSATPAGAAINAGGSIHVEVTAYKGVVPLEPLHRTFWGNLTELEILKDVKKGPGGCYLCDHPLYSNSFYHWPLVAPDQWVPPGTATVKGTLRWTNPGGAPSPPATEWRLLYKAANSPSSQAIVHKVNVDSVGTNSIEWSISPTALELDKWYQKSSYWIFYPDDQEDPIPGSGSLGCAGATPNDCAANTQQQTTWWLSATVYRDPAYVEEKAA